MSDDTGELLYSLDEGIARITMNAPDKLNSLSVEMLEAFPGLVTRAADEGARVLLLGHEGRAFCSGARLGAGAGQRDLGDSIEEYYNPLARALSDSPIPVVTALGGLAAGAGVGIALSADIVVAAKSSYLLLAFANIGLVPDAGSTWLLAKTIGRARTLEMALLAEKLPAEKAYEYGLVARLVEDDQVEAEALQVARKLAAMPTRTLGLIRKQVRDTLDGDFEASLGFERDHQRAAGQTADHREGVMAFLQKRAPNFTGE